MQERTDNRSLAEIFKILLPSLTVLIVFSCVLFGKGIFPFGTKTIDYYDMGQINAPLYYHAWDWLHGRSSLFFDWYINGGQNIAMAASNQWNLSPFILFFLFVPRLYLMRFLSVYIGLHLIGMTVAMQYFLYRLTPHTPRYFRGMFAIAYGLCGYTLTHYTATTFLDTAVFIPLLILQLFVLLKEGKYRGYSFMLALSIIISYYLGVIDLIYILIISGSYLILLCDKEQRSDRAGKLVLGTVAGVGMSAVVTVPVFFSLMKSSRISSNYDTSFSEMVIMILRAIGADQYYVKFWQLFAMEAAVIVILAGLIRFFKSEKKETVFAFIFFFAPCALIPFESINLIWHLGSYFHYPIRCGYLIPFSLLAVASYFAGKLRYLGGFTYEKARLWQIAAALLSAVIVAGSLILFFRHDVWQVEELFKIWVLFAGFFTVVYIVIFFVKPVPKVIFIWFMLAELIVGAAVGYGKPHIYDRFFSDPEQNGEYVETSLILKETLPIEESRLFRVKNPDTTLNANYGMIMRRATVCGWAQTLSRPVQKGAEAFGYSTHFMRILDSGGTVFTDALLGIRESIAVVPVTEKTCVYEKKQDYAEYGHYFMKYPFPYVNLIDEEDAVNSESELDIVGLHNALYAALEKGAGEVASETEAPAFAEWFYRGDGGNAPIRAKVSGHKLLYLRKGEAELLTVNGETVPVPSISELDNTKYPAWFNSNLICLGEFEDEEVAIGCPGEAEVFTLDIDMLERLSGLLADNEEKTGGDLLLAAGTSKMSFDINVEGGGKLAILPVNPDEYSGIKVNGQSVAGRAVGGMLTGVPVSEGDNFVEISFLPKGQVAGIVVTLGTLLIMLILYMKEKAIQGFFAAIGNASFMLVRVLWVLSVVFIYIIPIAAFVIHQIVKRIF